jgi:hypothetical protein
MILLNNLMIYFNIINYNSFLYAQSVKLNAVLIY